MRRAGVHRIILVEALLFWGYQSAVFCFAAVVFTLLLAQFIGAVTIGIASTSVRLVIVLLLFRLRYRIFYRLPSSDNTFFAMVLVGAGSLVAAVSEIRFTAKVYEKVNYLLDDALFPDTGLVLHASWVSYRWAVNCSSVGSFCELFHGVFQRLLELSSTRERLRG